MATGFNKWLFIMFLPVFVYAAERGYDQETFFTFRGYRLLHPLHVSVTEINHNATDKTLEISCKLFTDDFEKVLAKNYKAKVDLINPPDRGAMEKLVNDFIQKHLNIKADGKPVQLSYIGYEKDNDAVYTYLQVDNIAVIKKIELTNTILHELYTDEINLVHVMVGGNRKSVKLDYPETKAAISF